MKFLNNLDLNGNQLLSPVVHVSSQSTITNGPAGDTSGTEGQIFYNSHSNGKALFFRDNSAWRPIGDISGVTAGVGLSGGGTGGTVSLAIDFSEFSTVTPASGDFLATLDSDGANEQKTTTDALATLFAGSGLTASSAVIAVDTLNQDTSGTAAIATAVTVADESSDTSCNVLFTTAATGDLPPKSGTNLTFNSSSGLLTATLFAGDITGDITGNADTATALATARNIGGVSFDGTGNISLVSGSIPNNAADTTGNAATATILATTRALQVTLSETDSSNFNGSAAVTDIGVTGTLAVGNGGTGVTSMTNLKNALDDETWTFANNTTLAGFVLDGNTITGVDDSGEFTNDDAHIMTSAGVEDKITGYSYITASSSDTLSNKTIAASQVTEISNLTAAEGTQLEAIGTTTISATQWGYLGAATGAITNVNDNVSVANLKTALAEGFGSNAVTIGDSDDVVTIGNDLTVTGDLLVSGDTVTVDVATLSVEDPLIGMASGNGANSVDMGIWGKYTATGAKYTGLFRDASDSNMWKLFATTGNNHETPGTGTTINTTSGFTYANLTLGTLTGDVTGDLTGTAADATILETARNINGVSFNGSANITVTAAGSTLSDTVTVAKGGTGATSLTDGGILLGSGTGAITAMTALGDSEMLVGDGTTDPVAESGATLRTSIGCNPVAGSTSITTTGALGTGSIASGFGNIDNGSSTLGTGAATVASLVCTAAGTFGGGYGSTGATISTAGVGQFNGALTTGAALTADNIVCTNAATFGGGYGATGATISTAGVGQFNGALTTDGALTANELDIGAGGVDVDGALETNTLTIAGTAIVAQSTVTAVGGIETATKDEVIAGTDTVRAITPDTLAARSVAVTIDKDNFTGSNIVTITHALGTKDVIVQLFDDATDATVFADVYRTANDLDTASTSVISIDFGVTPTNDVRVLITSLLGATTGVTVAHS